MKLLFDLDPRADNPRGSLRRTATGEVIHITGACYTMLANWVKADQRARVNARDQLPRALALGIAHAGYRLGWTDPVSEAGLDQTSLGTATPATALDLLDIIMTCRPAPSMYFSVGLSPFGMGGHIVGFKVTQSGGDYLDPAAGLYRAVSRADLLWNVREKIKEYVDMMQARCPTVEIELWALEPR